MYGHDIVDAVDVVHALADSHTSTGQILAAAGVTEESISRWRRARAEPASLAMTLSTANPGVDSALAATNSRGVEALLAPPAIYGAMVAALLLRTDTDPTLEMLCGHLSVNRKRLARSLESSRKHRARTPSQRWPGMSVWEREGRYVFEPERTADAEHGGGLVVPTQAVVTAAGPSASEIGHSVLHGLSVYGVADATDRDPFWTAFGARTREGFTRRARQVMVAGNDFSVSLHTTVHVSRNEYQVRSDRTPLRAPIDDAEALGRAVVAAIAGSRG